MLAVLEFALEVLAGAIPRPHDVVADAALVAHGENACACAVPVVVEPPLDVFGIAHIMPRVVERGVQVDEIDSHRVT